MLASGVKQDTLGYVSWLKFRSTDSFGFLLRKDIYTFKIQDSKLGQEKACLALSTSSN